MKHTQLLLIVTLMAVAFIAQQADAKIWRVNNKSNYNGRTLWGDNLGGTASYPVFTQIDSALTAGGNALVAAGDTLYVEASPLTYNRATINRRVIIIGAGYFLSQNPHVSSIIDSSSIGEVDFNAGSEGSQIIGMSDVVINNYFSINVNDITVKRCNLHHTIQIASNLNDVYILENFFSSATSNPSAIGAPGNGFVFPTNLIFNNNVCQMTLIWRGSLLQCNNNTFDPPGGQTVLQFATSEFKNNILKSLNATTNINNGSNLNVSYNIGTSSSQFGTDNNNIVVSNISSLFVSSTSPDGVYQIASGTAANNSGSDGTDRGAFGGAATTDRYTLSGLAAIPVIYSIATSGATSGNLPVTIQARTIK